MFKGNSDHIVLKIENFGHTRDFYERIVGLQPQTVLNKYITYQLGNFNLCFKEFNDLKSPGLSVVHLGIEFKTRAEVDQYFKKFIESDYQLKPKEIIGGPKQGPYRFYVKDPSGYTLEFESWENCSD